ncbi:MAG TPA: 4-alpha-glucanotransferase [Streptosporangiaceae bacterium]|nr:4-alpha-glucanotransferase [Streptosporangiaceae bacterium]
MTARTELTRRALAHGVAVSYQNWRGHLVEVPDETLAAVLYCLGGNDPPQTPPALGEMPSPQTALAQAGSATVGGGPVAPFPARRSWGFTVQLYSVRSRASWGHGDLRDLADLATWSGRELGADFVLVNPLHAAEPLPPISPSPYLPMTRRHVSPLYLRIEDIPEYGRLGAADRARVDDLGAPLRTASTTAALIDRDAVWAAKRAALEIVHSVPLGPDRRADFDAFRAPGRGTVDEWAVWCAIAEAYGPDWRTWPAALTDPCSAEVTAFGRSRADRVDFHAWLQWLAAEQSAAAQLAARHAGMTIGVINDLAVGAHPGGADAWARQDVIVSGVSVGAPPDEFNQLGQDWTLPPWHPGWLSALRAKPLAELAAATTRHAGGMRIDHVMGLARLWWIPAGMSPGQGTYVRYDHELLGGVLAAEAARAGALVIGEDLGTVEPGLRHFLAARRLLGTSMLWFERRADGTPRRPRGWRRGCLATVGTHDMPPAAAFLTGEQVTIRAGLGLLTRPEKEERAAARTETARWLAVLAREGLLSRQAGPPGASGVTPEEFTAALYAYLTRTPSMLVGVSLAEAVGERRPQNMPGTVDEYPNWRIPLAGSDGRPVMLEDLPAHPGVRTVAEAVSGGLGRRGRYREEQARARSASERQQGAPGDFGR